MSADPAAVISAVAACIAAVLAGATLWVTGRREERQWRRDAVTDVAGAFLDASYRRIHTSTYTALLDAFRAQVGLGPATELLSTDEQLARYQSLLARENP